MSSSGTRFVAQIPVRIERSLAVRWAAVNVKVEPVAYRVERTGGWDNSCREDFLYGPGVENSRSAVTDRVVLWLSRHHHKPGPTPAGEPNEE